MKKWMTGLFCLVFAVFIYSDKTFKLVIIDSDTGEPYKSAREALIETLRKNGYSEKKNLEIIYQSVGNDVKKAEIALAELLKNKPDVVFANGTAVAIAAKNLYLNKDIKFVYACVTDAVGVGIINRVGDTANANFVGVSYPVPVKSRLQFVKAVMPNVKKIGLIYANMPQSVSYRKWLEEALKDPAFKGIEIIFKSVPLIKGEDGPKKMAEQAKKYVKELDKIVDVFLSPNDQLGANQDFPKMVAETASKPLIGLGKKDVMDGWGATAAIFPSHESMGKQSAEMIMKIFNGSALSQIRAEWVKETGIALDLRKAYTYGIKIQENLVKIAKENVIK